VLLLAALLLGAFTRRRVALRALWTGATRPWRLPSLTTMPTRLDRVLVIGIPAIALVASRAIYTWFAAPAHLVITLGAWLLCAVGLRWVVRGRDPFLLWAAIGGVAMLRTVILLVALSLHGPGGYWFSFWTAPTLRFGYITVAFAAFAWLFVVATGVLRHAYGLPRRRAVGTTMASAGVTLGLLAGLVAAIGLERALTIWNDQMALLPWGLSRILGITVYLGIPTELPAVVSIAGLAVAAIGTALSLRYRRRMASEASRPVHRVPRHLPRPR
jgi:hypothetical protein